MRILEQRLQMGNLRAKLIGVMAKHHKVEDAYDIIMVGPEAGFLGSGRIGEAHNVLRIPPTSFYNNRIRKRVKWMNH